MKSNLFKIIFTLLIFAFSLIWINEKLTVLIENDKYCYCETTEKSDTENQTESKLKTLFVNPINLLNLSLSLLSNSKNNNSFYSFKIKEFCFENLTPPPEKV